MAPRGAPIHLMGRSFTSPAWQAPLLRSPASTLSSLRAQLDAPSSTATTGTPAPGVASSGNKDLNTSLLHCCAGLMLRWAGAGTGAGDGDEGGGIAEDDGGWCGSEELLRQCSIEWIVWRWFKIGQQGTKPPNGQ